PQYSIISSLRHVLHACNSEGEPAQSGSRSSSFAHRIRNAEGMTFQRLVAKHRFAITEEEAKHLNENDLSDESDTTSEKRSGTIQSVSIAARFLRILANAETELALSEVARRAKTRGSTAHRYLQSLVKEGLAKQDAASGLYDLGPT